MTEHRASWTSIKRPQTASIRPAESIAQSINHGGAVVQRAYVFIGGYRFTEILYAWTTAPHATPKPTWPKGRLVRGTPDKFSPLPMQNVGPTALRHGDPCVGRALNLRPPSGAGTGLNSVNGHSQTIGWDCPAFENRTHTPSPRWATHGCCVDGGVVHDNNRLFETMTGSRFGNVATQSVNQTEDRLGRRR